MRKSLFTAAAAAPLVLLAAGPALAQYSGGSTSSQVQTATAGSGGAPADVTVNSGSTVNVDAPNTAAVVLNSNNSITNNGTISINANKANDNSQAVLLNGGFTGSLTNAGTISNTDNYTPGTNSTNGYANGAFAQGTARYGVQLIGSNPLTGSITLNSGSSITVQGNSSYGVSLEAPLNGDLVNAGTISITGDNSTGLSVAGAISGKLQLTGSVTANGQGAQAVNIQGDVGAAADSNGNHGVFSVYSAISSTGFRTTVRNIDPTLNNELTSDQVEQSGSAVTIGGNLHGGFFLGSTPAGTDSTNTTIDADNDGIVDSVEGVGTITTYGTAPALVIGSSSKTVELSVSPYGAAVNKYGMILEGSVTGNGVFDSTLTGVSASTPVTAIQVGGSLGTANSQAVTIDGGISITDTSTVSAQAYQQSAMAMHFGAFASTPVLNNAGTISALSTETTSGTVTNTTALQIDAHASLPSLVNSGVINSTLTGDTGNAYGVIDQSGTLSSVLNTGKINANITPASPTDTITGSQIALDLRANTSGVSLVQETNDQANIATVTNPSSATNSTTGGTITFATTVSQTTPSITGDVLLGNGPNTVDLETGTVAGELLTGSGTSTLTINGGASYTGALVAGSLSSSGQFTPGVLGVNVNNGSLTDTSTRGITATSLHVGSSGTLIFAVDPVSNTATQINVLPGGTASIDDGAKLGVNMLSLLKTNESYTVISAPTLTVGSGFSSMTAQTPYLFVANFTPNANGTLTLDLRRRTAAEAAVNKAEVNAWDPVYNNLDLNPGIERAFLAQTTAAGYRSMLDQLMPDYAGGAFRGISWITEQQDVAAADPPVGQDQQGPTRAWTQEIVMDETKRSTTDSTGYSLLGIGAVAGLESVSPKGDAIGAKIGFITTNVRNPDLPGDNLLGVSELNAGVYMREKLGGLQADAQFGAGFIWANDRREFLYSDSGGVVHNVALGNWDGYTLSGRIGLQYRADVGRFFIEPKVHADYFRMFQTGYTESGGGVGYDLKVDPRTGDLVSVTGTVLAGMTFGNTGFRWAPQIEVGYRDVVMGNAGTTTAMFAGGTADPMTLLAQPIKGGEALARVGIRMYTDYVDVLLDAGAQIASDYTDLDVHLTARTVF